jgi:hypothetical protein
MREKIHKGAIYIIDKDEATFDKSILGDTEGRKIIFLESSKKQIFDMDKFLNPSIFTKIYNKLFRRIKTIKVEHYKK